MLRVDGPVVPEPVAAEVRWKPILIFTVLAWGFGWLVSLPLWIDPMGLASVHALWVLPTMMFTPCAAAAIVVLLQQRVPVRQAVRQLGIVPLRPVGKLLRFSLGGIVLLPLVVIAGIAVAAFLHLVRLDLETFSGFAAMLPEDARDLLPIGVLVLVQVISIPIAAPLNGVLAFGEEVGWRGLLLPALRPLGDWPAVLITGVVWGVWHAPIVLLGYNFDRPDLWGGLPDDRRSHRRRHVPRLAPDLEWFGLARRARARRVQRSGRSGAAVLLCEVPAGPRPRGAARRRDLDRRCSVRDDRHRLLASIHSPLGRRSGSRMR